MYVRKSTEGDDRQVHSIADQIEVLTNLAERYDIKVKSQYIFKESRSARKPSNRPQFDKLIELINAGKINGIVVWKVDRLSRNPTESGLLQQLLQDGKIQHIKSPDRDYFPKDNALILSVETSIGNQYVRDLSDNVKRGIRAAVRAGRIAGVAPAGYLNRQIDGRKFIEPDPERWPLIRKAFDEFLTGNYTVMELKQMLNEWGYITRWSMSKKSGGKPISRSAMYKVLNNRRYMGIVPHPDYPDDPNYDVKGDFPPMITEDEYYQVQSLLGNKTRSKYAILKHFELRGLFRCGQCGCMVTAHVVPKKLKDGSINKHIYYHCTRKKGPCSQKAVTEAKLFAQIDELLNKYELSPQLFDWGLAAIKDIAKAEIAERDDIQKMQFVSIDEIQRQLDKLLDLATKEAISTETYKLKAEALELELAKRQQEQKDTADRVKNWYEIIGITLERLCNATENFRNGDFGIRREILLAIGCNPIIMDKTISIEPNPWVIPIQDNLPQIKSELVKVETVSPINKNKSSLDREQSLVSSWCG
jgi:site-specific DNA recombinase